MQGSISFDGTLAGSIAGGGGGGTTPIISADATVDSLSGDPTCTVSRTGTDEMPTFHFAFSGIVGEEGPEGPEGPQGETGTTGATGPQGPAGVGVPSGGATGDVLRKDSTTDYDTYWDTLTALDIPYDNTSSGMTATDVQAAVTELKSNFSQLDGLTVYKNLTPQTSYADFDDGSTLPLISLTSNIDPIQNLHGYDHPWVGGAGKNKFKTDFENTTLQGVTITKTSDGRVLTSGVPSTGFAFTIGHIALKAGSYILNGCPSGGGPTTYRLQVTDYPVRYSLGQDEGNGISFTLSEDMEVAVRIQFYTGASASLEFAPMIRLASVTDAKFEPYSNICPISGFTEVNVTRCGKNLLGGETLGQSIVNAVNYSANTYLGEDTDGNYVTYMASGYIANKVFSENLKFKENTRYTFIFALKRDTSSSQTNATNIVVEYTDGTYAQVTFPSVPTLGIKTTFAYTTLANKTVANLKLGNYSGRLYLYYTESGIFEGVITASDFKPYNGQTYTVEFKVGSNTLTVYGSTLDVVSGELKVVPYYASYNGETLEGEWISDRDVYAVGTTPTIGAQVVNIGATPTTYQLTPTQVNSLLGQNYISSDTGNITNIKYLGILNFS